MYEYLGGSGGIYLMYHALALVCGWEFIGFNQVGFAVESDAVEGEEVLGGGRI